MYLGAIQYVIEYKLRSVFISIYIIKLASQLSFQDHIVEVLSKWDNIDDEIWAKV